MPRTIRQRQCELQFFLRSDEVAAEMESHGLSSVAARRGADLFRQTAIYLLEQGMSQDAPVSAFWMPGRIEVLGKHTDYAGGLSLVAALERGICVLSAHTEGNDMEVFDAVSGSSVNLTIADAEGTVGWERYPLTVWKRLRQNFALPPRGCSIGFASNLPQAAGMSSSSALMVAIYTALHDLFELSSHPRFVETIRDMTELADYLGHIENGQTYRGHEGEAGVGTFGGSQDHAAILCARARHLSLFSFLPTRHLEAVSVGMDRVFCIASSGVRAEKAEGARAGYNDAVGLVRRLLEIWRLHTGRPVSSLVEVFREPGFTLADFQKLLSGIEDSAELQDRLNQCYAEVVEVIPAAVSALKEGDTVAWGRLVDRSQQMAEHLLKNQVSETRFLAREARRLGAVAASAFGAGFGGSVWAMVDRDGAEEFASCWREAYVSAFPRHAGDASFFIDATGPGAFRLGQSDIGTRVLPEFSQT